MGTHLADVGDRGVSPGYFATAGQALFVPAEPTRSATRCSQLFMLDKALYELNYELNNRPDWVRIPLAAFWTSSARVGRGQTVGSRTRTDAGRR